MTIEVSIQRIPRLTRETLGDLILRTEPTPREMACFDCHLNPIGTQLYLWRGRALCQSCYGFARMGIRR